MPLEGCLQSRGGWCRLIQGCKESGMVNPLELSALVGTDHRTGRLVGRLHREGGVVEPGQCGSPLDGGLDPWLGAGERRWRSAQQPGGTPILRLEEMDSGDKNNLLIQSRAGEVFLQPTHVFPFD